MVVIDASVAAKWFFDEPLADEAERIARTSKMIAPGLFVQEMHYVLWKKLRNGTISPIDAKDCALDMARSVQQLVPNEELAVRAAEIMIELVHPIYDCLYLALAERERAPLITVDRGLIEAGSRLGSVRVVHLQDF